MTQKELLYIEDAIGHEKSIISICNDTISKLQNEELVNFINQEIENHNTILTNLTNLLEAKSNGW